MSRKSVVTAGLIVERFSQLDPDTVVLVAEGFKGEDGFKLLADWNPCANYSQSEPEQDLKIRFGRYPHDEDCEVTCSRDGHFDSRPDDRPAVVLWTRK